MNNTTTPPRAELAQWETEGGSPLPAATPPGGDAPLLKRRMALFLHEHKSPAAPA